MTLEFCFEVDRAKRKLTIAKTNRNVRLAKLTICSIELTTAKKPPAIPIDIIALLGSPDFDLFISHTGTCCMPARMASSLDADNMVALMDDAAENSAPRVSIQSPQEPNAV